MTIQTILHYPDSRLRNIGEKIGIITPNIRALINDMAETMYKARGVGLAATQIGEPFQIFLIDIAADNEPSDLRVFINSEILKTDEIEISWAEGCLSFPGVTEEIKRSYIVRVKALDRDGVSFELSAEGLLAVAIQHEHDHLQGILMIDYLGPLKKRIVHRKMLKRANAAKEL
jgi:peptide deformylase